MAAEITLERLIAASMAGEAEGPDAMRLVARAYARLGLAVLPIWHALPDGSCACADPTHAPGGRNATLAGKHPMNRNGVKRATTDPRLIDSWWFRWPLAGIGLATGDVVDVVDIDDKNALQAVADLLSAGRLPTPIAWARTGRSEGTGLHCFIRSVPGAPSGQRLLPGLDYRGAGGYVLAAPTIHRSLATYAWLPTPPDLPTGDATRGTAISATLPWESSSGTAPTVDPRERAYAAARLEGQAADVRTAPPGERIARLRRAAFAMGARVHRGHIARDTVETVLLAAYATAGGSHPDAANVLSRALAASAHTAIRPLPEVVPPDLHEALHTIRLWSASPEGRKALRGMRRPALQYMLACAEESGTLTFRMSHRELVKAIHCSTTTAGRVLKDLSAATVLETVARGSRAGEEAAIYRLRVPRGFSHDGALLNAQRSVPPGDVPRAEKVGHPEPAVGRPAFTAMVHSLFTGTGRGPGHGLTYADQRLLAALPEDGSPMRTVEWGRAADCAPATVHRALDASQRSMASLGLVERCGWGQARATPQGLPLVRAIRGLDTAEPLDALAEVLGVASRAALRIAEVEAEQDEHGRDLVRPGVVRALRGREGHRRDVQRIRRRAGDDVASAVTGLLADLDAAGGNRAARKAVARLIEAVIDSAAPETLADEDLDAAGIPSYSDPWRRLSEPPTRAWDMAIIASGVRLVSWPPTAFVDNRTGETLSEDQAEQALRAGRPVSLMSREPSDVEKALARVDAALRLCPMPTIRELLSSPRVRRPLDGAPTASPGYAPITVARPWHS